MKCSICQEIFIDPIVIVCGHNFCKHCIEEWHKNFIEENPYEEPSPCPECRTVFKTVYPNISLKNFITDLSAVILDKEEKKKREETIKERLEKKDSTPISSGAGDKIFSLAYIADFLSAPNVFDVAATPAPVDMDTAVAGVGAIQGEEPNRCIHCCECELRGNLCAHTTLAWMCINCSQLLTERQQNIQEQAENQVNQSYPYPIRTSSYLYQGQAPALEQTPVAPTLPRSQLLSAPNTPSLAPPMNLVEQNIQGQTPVLGQTPVAPTLPRSHILLAPNMPSLAQPMNLVEPNFQEHAENQVYQSHQHPMELIPASSYLYQGQAPVLGQTPAAPTLPRSQVLSAPNSPSLAPSMNLVEQNIQRQTLALGQTPVAPTFPRSQVLLASNALSLAPPMNLVEQNIQGRTPALAETPVAPTFPRSQLLSAPNAPSLAPPMNLVEPDSTTSDIQYFRHFNGRVNTWISPRSTPYSREQDRPRRSANQIRTLGALWNPR